MLRPRTPVVLGSLAALTAVHLFYGLRRILLDPFGTDFTLYYSAALIGLHQGWAHLYDLPAQERALAVLAPTREFLAYLNPPPMAWVVAPLTILPLPFALALWSAASAVALVAAWRLLAPGRGLVRLSHTLVPLALWPAVFGLALGQPVALIVAALILSWWLLRQDREVVAGLVLTTLALKPNIVIMVPICLLLGGRIRTVAVFTGGVAALALVSVLSLGAVGVRQYVELSFRFGSQVGTHTLYSHPPYTFSGLLGDGPLTLLLIGVAAAAAMGAAWRHRGGDPGLALAAGLVGSLLVAGYLHAQDLLLLAVACALIFRVRGGELEKAILIGGFLVVEAAVGLMEPVIPLEALVLAYLMFRSARPVGGAAAAPAPHIPTGA